MANLPASTILGHVCRTISSAEFGGLRDDELLRRSFGGRGPETAAAFSVLLDRHAALVYRTCFAILRDVHDAEDAFQATFLVLARKAKSLRAQQCLGPWLYEVARRIAAHARAAAERRARHEREAAVPPDCPTDAIRCEALATLHAALGRLPVRLRHPIVLCDLENCSYEEAAAQLGVTLPAIRNRLSRGRRRLGNLLRRLGFDSSSLITVYGAIPSAPRALLNTTAHRVAEVALGSAAGALPASILALTNKGLQTMLLIKLKPIGLSLVAAAALIAGAYGLSGQSPTDKGKAGEPAREAARPTPPATLADRSTTAALVAKLTGPASIDKPIDAQPLKDVLEFLGGRFGVTFIVDIQAFDRIGKKTVEDEQVRLPRMPGVTLDTILRHLLAQVQGAILVRHNHLEVTSYDQSVLESRNGVQISFPWEEQPLVNVVCEEHPLDKILTNLSRQSGRNVILDSRVKDRDRLTATVTLLNTPLDTAARVIAETLNLKTVSIDNVIFVTSREHAAELIAEEKELRERRKTIAVEIATPLKSKQ
jgi:RNA polymerase sigma factor (sigma-70 family)